MEVERKALKTEGGRLAGEKYKSSRNRCWTKTEKWLEQEQTDGRRDWILAKRGLAGRNKG